MDVPQCDSDLVLLDDRDGRNIAKSVGITFAGSIGILLRYYHGHPTDFEDALDEFGTRVQIEQRRIRKDT